jgi:Tfp pilus assembly protein PilO
MNTYQSQVNKTLRQFYDKPIAKVSAELFFSIAAVIFFAFFAIRPTLVTMSNLVKEIKDKEELNEKLKQKVASLSTVQGIYLGLQSRLLILDEAIPSSPKLEDALLLIEKTAGNNHLIIDDVEVKEVPKEDSELIPFSQKELANTSMVVVVSGQYPEIRQFVEDIHNLRREMTISSIVFSLSDSRGVKRLQGNITISLPYFAPTTQGAATPSAAVQTGGH